MMMPLVPHGCPFVSPANNSNNGSMHNARPQQYIYQMKRKLVESVIDEHFAKYCAEDVKITEFNKDLGDDGELETIIDVEGEKECSYIRKVLEEPVMEIEKKKPSWSVADMLREEPPKRQKARRKPQTPLCYREQQDELMRPYHDFNRVPYMPYNVMQTFMHDQALEYNTHMRQNYAMQHNMQNPQFCSKRSNIGSHQFSILGHRRIKSRSQRMAQNSPLDVQNLVRSRKSPSPASESEPEIVDVDKTRSPVLSPKPKYVPKFFQNLERQNVEKYVDQKAKDFFASMIIKSGDGDVKASEDSNSTDTTIDVDTDDVDLTDRKDVEMDSSESDVIRNEEKDPEPVVREKEPLNFVTVVNSFIACMLDRGALDLSKATASSSRLIHDKLNNVPYTCACQYRRKVNPSRSSAKAGVLEPLPTTCSPSPPPPPEAHQSEEQSSEINHHFFLERTRELNFANFRPQMPTFLHHPQFMQSYDSLFKMALPTFPMLPQPNFSMNGQFLVPTMPPPKRARLIPTLY